MLIFKGLFFQIKVNLIYLDRCIRLNVRCKDSHFWGHGGGLVDGAADSGLYDPSLIPLGEKKENKRKRGLGWPLLKKR